MEKDIEKYREEVGNTLKENLNLEFRLESKGRWFYFLKCIVTLIDLALETFIVSIPLGKIENAIWGGCTIAIFSAFLISARFGSFLSRLVDDLLDRKMSDIKKAKLKEFKQKHAETLSSLTNENIIKLCGFPPHTHIIDYWGYPEGDEFYVYSDLGGPIMSKTVHRGDCEHLKIKSEKLHVFDVENSRYYEPCKFCNPPINKYSKHYFRDLLDLRKKYKDY